MEGGWFCKDRKDRNNTDMQDFQSMSCDVGTLHNFQLRQLANGNTNTEGLEGLLHTCVRPT
jgi:heterodisulfide reductase subunit B